MKIATFNVNGITMAPSGGGSDPGTAWQFSRRAAFHWRSRRGLPGNEPDEHSRYLEAAIDGIIVACVYLPNCNPQPGPKFEYKLTWLGRVIAHGHTLYESGHPVVLAGDFNVVSTDFDIYNTRSWKKDALLQPASREAYRRLLSQGWIDALRVKHPTEPIFTFWDYFRNHWQPIQDCESIICC